MVRANSLEHQYDSVMQIMRDKSVPLLNRYYMTAEIGIFSFPQQIKLMEALIPEAKQFEDKAVITRMYSIMANTMILSEDLKAAKQYLDSAYVYKDQVENQAILGVMYFTRGHYFQSMNDLKSAHESYYQATEHLQRLATKPPLLTTIYYDLARIYALWEDEDRLKELIVEMKEVPYHFTEQYLMNYSVIADLFSVQFTKTQQPALLDSIIKYNELAIEQYNIHATEETPDVGHQLSQNYISLVRAYINKREIENARKSLELAERYGNKDRWSVMMELNVEKGNFYILTQENDKAEEALNMGLQLLGSLKDELQTNYSYHYMNIYEKLGYIYEGRKMYDKALEYEKKALEYRKAFFSRESTEIVNDLRTQYNVDQKERIVDQLTLLSERRKNIILLVGAVLILLILLIVQIIIRSRIARKANENKLKLEQMKRKESELEVELYKSREEEKEREFEFLQSEMQQRRMQSYLDGLEAARERLSKELHDNISNELLALKMRVQQAENPENIIKRIGEIHAEVRAVSHDLMPPAFQHAQFTEVLYDYVGQWNELSNAELTLTFDPDDESWDALPENINLGLYRIIQEAVGNAFKHANTTEIDISLSSKLKEISPSESKKLISLVIADNGKGFDAARVYKGIGLKVIKDRAESLNGKAMIESVPNKGTKVKIELVIQ